VSAICGIWSADPERRGLTTLVQCGLDAMAHRSPDGFSHYHDGHCALGHGLFDTGCNGLHIDEDGFAISFDGRLDNRGAVIRALRSEGLYTGQLPDIALILAAYRQWGTDLPLHLRGDFAIAIWDPAKNGLMLCRDHFGVRPLFWRKDNDCVQFSSEIKGLKAMALPEPEGNPVLPMAGYVEGQLDHSQPHLTWHAGVFRVLPGHVAWIDGTGVAVLPYWTLNPGLPVKRKDAARQFRSLFRQAVRRRTRATASVGALLSGGLDSTVIVGMLATGEGGRPLEQTPVYSLVFSGEADESAFIAAAEAQFGITAHRIDGAGISAFDDVDAVIQEQDHPIPAPNIATFRHFLRRVATQCQARIILDGHGGDEAVSYGNGLFQELAESGAWGQLWRELGASKGLQSKRSAHFTRLIRQKGLQGWRRKLARMIGRRPTQLDPVRIAPGGVWRPYEQAFHLSKLTSPLFALALEGIDHNAAAAGLEVRMPFLDVDLIEFCVTLRAGDKWKRGQSRAIMREALADILPPEIAAREDKFDFSSHVRASLAGHHRAMIDAVLRDEDGALAGLTDLDALRSTWDALCRQDEVDGEAFHRLWRAVMLTRWLEVRHAPTPMLEAAE